MAENPFLDGARGTAFTLGDAERGGVTGAGDEDDVSTQEGDTFESVDMEELGRCSGDECSFLRVR